MVLTLGIIAISIIVFTITLFIALLFTSSVWVPILTSFFVTVILWYNNLMISFNEQIANPFWDAMQNGNYTLYNSSTVIIMIGIILMGIVAFINLMVSYINREELSFVR